MENALGALCNHSVNPITSAKTELACSKFSHNWTLDSSYVYSVTIPYNEMFLRIKWDDLMEKGFTSPTTVVMYSGQLLAQITYAITYVMTAGIENAVFQQDNSQVHTAL